MRHSPIAACMPKAFRFHATGGPEVLRFEDVDAAPPGPGQVRMRNEAVAVNYRDILLRRGAHRVAALPSGIGLESAGTIEAIGEGVSDLGVGDRVACVAGPDGAYATHRIVPAARVVRLPAAIAAHTAAAMMIRGMTARYLLHETFSVKTGDTILVHAAAGGVGLIMCQWAKHLGATVIGTVGSAAKADIARQHGCDHPIVEGEDFVARVHALTGGRGVDIVLDSIGLPTQSASMAMLAPFGELVHFGDAGGFPAPVNPDDLYERSLKVSAFGLDERHEPLAAAQARRDLVAWAADGSLRFRIDRVLPLAQAAEAHRLIESRRTIGKIVLAG